MVHVVIVYSFGGKMKMKKIVLIIILILIIVGIMFLIFKTNNGNKSETFRGKVVLLSPQLNESGCFRTIFTLQNNNDNYEKVCLRPLRIRL